MSSWSGREYEILGRGARAREPDATLLLEQGEDYSGEGDVSREVAPTGTRRRLIFGVLTLVAAISASALWTGRLAAHPASHFGDNDCGGAPCGINEIGLSAKKCHTVVKGVVDDELCYLRVDWVMREGISKHPDWYKGLSKKSTLEEVQKHVASEENSPCQMPCRSEGKAKGDVVDLAVAEERADALKSRDGPSHKATGAEAEEDEVEETEEAESSEKCVDGWKLAPGCLPEYKYNGKTITGCSLTDAMEEGQAWCSNEPEYKSLWSVCLPCEMKHEAKPSTTTTKAGKPSTTSNKAPKKTTEASDECYTVKSGVESDKDCYDRVRWVMMIGVDEHPDYYEELGSKPSFEEVQRFVSKEADHACPWACDSKAKADDNKTSKDSKDKDSKHSTERKTTTTKATTTKVTTTKAKEATTSGHKEKEPHVKCPACAPKKPSVPDVVIPFFERDLCKLKYTAESFAKNDPHNLLGDVFLMWVSDKQSSDYQDDLDEILASIKDTHNVHFKDYANALQSSGISGWFGQQVLKLKIAHEVSSDFYVVVDAKNTLIREVEPDSFFTECNQAKIQAEFRYDDIPRPHSDWYERSAGALGLQPPSEGYWPASITPVVMHKNTVLDMLGEMGEDPDPQNLCRGPLCDLMGAYSESGIGATEFTMYTLWAYQKAQLECLYFVQQLPHFKVEYSSGWRDELEASLKDINLTTKAQQKQITVSSSDGRPIEWSPGDTDAEEPGEEKFPLKFEDLTASWAASLWRGVPENADLLEAVNLWTLTNLVEGKRQFPLMFGAQPEALSTMNDETRQKATEQLSEVYSKAKLHDGSESDDDLVACVVGWQN